MKTKYLFIVTFVSLPLIASIDKKINAEKKKTFAAKVVMSDTASYYSCKLNNGYSFRVVNGQQVSPTQSLTRFNYKKPCDNDSSAQHFISLTREKKIKEPTKTEWTFFTDGSIE